jgi:hypothetical protein
VPFETDFNPAAVHDDRHAALVAGVLEHLREAMGRLQHVDVLDGGTLPFVGFTSRLGVGSGVLAEDEDGGWHTSLLGPAVRPKE